MLTILWYKYPIGMWAFWATFLMLNMALGLYFVLAWFVFNWIYCISLWLRYGHQTTGCVWWHEALWMLTSPAWMVLALTVLSIAGPDKNNVR